MSHRWRSPNRDAETYLSKLLGKQVRSVIPRHEGAESTAVLLKRARRLLGALRARQRLRVQRVGGTVGAAHGG